jgi:hypothetical protein
MGAQPAAEMIAFRIGELQGLSRWRARVHRVGLHETLMERAMEHAGMLLVQVECLLRTISDTAGEVSVLCSFVHYCPHFLPYVLAICLHYMTGFFKSGVRQKLVFSIVAFGLYTHHAWTAKEGSVNRTQNYCY